MDRGDAAAGRPLRTPGDFILHVASRYDWFRTACELPPLESLGNSPLAAGQLASYVVFHSKSLRASGVMEYQHSYYVAKRRWISTFQKTFYPHTTKLRWFED
jgi:hypothetical protein